MGSLSFPIGYYLLHLDRLSMLTIMIPLTLVMILIDISRIRQWSFWTGFASKIATPIIRRHELQGDFTGATYILTSFCLTVALYTKPVAIAAMAFIIVGDTFAALVGRRYGRIRFFGRKSVEGSLACLGACLVVAFLVPGLSIKVAISGAIIAAVVEALPLGIDDNVTVPILSGLGMTLIARFVGSF